MTIPHRVLYIVLLLVLFGCGDPEAHSNSAAVAGQNGSSGPDDRTAVSGRSGESTAKGFVNAVEVRVTGGVDTTFALQDGDVSFGGGCTGSTPVSMGFHRGNWAVPPHEWTNLAFTTVDLVGTGETGAFDVEEITWDHGVVMRPMGERTVPIPNRFTGSGTLTVSEHRAALDDRRLIGRLQGSGLSNDDGEAVDLLAEVDLNFSCGTALIGH